jgi:protein gp37
MLLTKRIGNAFRMLPVYRLPNVWLGITVVDQAEADRDVPKLLALNEGAVRWLSIEPLLGPIDLTSITNDNGETWNALEQVEADDALAEGACGGVVNWVIVGGESGPGARPMNPQWVRSLRDQCARYDVPFHFKQWGEWVSVSEVAGMGAHHTFPDGRTVRRAIGRES